MLDERTTVLLKILEKKCSYGSYKVITSDELILDFPVRYGADKDLVWQMISNLSQKGFLSIRYDRDGEFCLSLTPKGRLYLETDVKQAESSKKSPITDLLPHFYDFLAVFLAIVLSGILLKALGVIC